MKKKVEFFFDINSPYTYLASLSVEQLMRDCDAELVWRPFLLGAVFKLTGNSSPMTVPAKGKYLFSDLTDLLAYHKAPFNFPKQFPLNSILAMRTLTGLTQEEIPDAAHKLFKAYWVDGIDISDEKIVTELTNESAVVKATTTEIKEQLKTTTQDAVDRGAFGSPTFYVDDKMFFGSDRMFLLEAYLKGEY